MGEATFPTNLELAKRAGVYSGNFERPFLYFSYGTLKNGFPNHGFYENALGHSYGEYTTCGRYPLIVTKSRRCSNPGCRYNHRGVALMDQEGHGHHVVGEVFALDDSGLQQLDQLENFDPNHPEKSTFLRKTIEVCGLAENSEQICCFVYFAANPEEYLRSLDTDHSEMVDNFTLDMAEQELKECCKSDPGHGGLHVIKP